jgi:hypothetical protein
MIVAADATCAATVTSTPMMDETTRVFTCSLPSGLGVLEEKIDRL